MQINTYELQAHADQIKINLNTMLHCVQSTQEQLAAIETLLPDDRMHQFDIQGPHGPWPEFILAKSPAEAIEKARKIIDETPVWGGGKFRVFCGGTCVRSFTHQKKAPQHQP